MNKRLSILFIFMLVFQTISSGLFLPSQTVAEGSEQSIFTGISYTDEDGEVINIDEVDGESAVNVHVDWSIAHVEIEAGSTESFYLPDELYVEGEQQGELTDGEAEIGTFQAAIDGAVTVYFNEEIEDHAEASGTFVIQTESPEVADEEVSSENEGSESETDAVKEEDDAGSASEETNGTEEEAGTTEQEEVEERVGHNFAANNEREPQQIDENIINELKLMREDGFEYEEGDFLELGEDLSLELDWSLPNGHEYQAGDTFEFQLPEALAIYNDVDGDLDGYGTYHVTTNGEVTFTFSESIENESDISGGFWVETELNEQVIQKSTEVLEFEFNDDVIERIMINVRPENGQAIQKNGQPVDGNFNTEEIEWTVILNTTRENLENAVVTDPILDGQELILDSIDLQEVEVNMQGEVVEVLEGEVSFENSSTTDRLELELGDTNQAYQLTFRTEMKEEEKDEEGWTTYENTAYLNSDDKEQVQSGSSVSVERPESLTKSSSDFDPETRSVEWEVNANFTEKELSSGTEIVDEFTFTMDEEEVNDVFEVTEENIDIQQVESFDENGEVEQTSNANDLFDISIDGNQVMYTLNEDSNKAFIITYTTTASEDAYITHNGEISNTVGIDGETKTSNAGVGQQVGVKSHSEVNYEDKTVDWTITINADSQSLNNFILTDDFSGSGQQLVEDSIVVDPAINEGAIVPNQDGEGFEINFGDINEPYTITYTTGFTYDFGDTDYKPSFRNDVHVSYTTTDNDEYELKFGDNVNPNEETRSNGAKNSSVNNETKEITWMVDINYNQLELENASLIDEIPDNQSLVDGTVEIYPTTIAPNGDINVGENEVDGFTVEASENEVNIEFGTIDQSYRVVFVTEDKDGIYNSGEVYENTAEFSPRGEQAHELTANATLPNQGVFIGKNGEHNMDDWTIDWKLLVNESRSTIHGVTVTDDLGDRSLQILLEDTIEVINVDTDEALVAGEDYQLNADGNAFSVTFSGEITDAYEVTYSSYIVAEESADMDNEAAVETVDDVIVGHVNADETIEVRMSTGGGSGEGTTGELILEKLETDTNRPLEEVAFTLIREVGDQDIVVREETTDENGEIHWTGLQFGEYTLEEVIPEGYLGEESQVIELSSDEPEGIKTLPIYNERETGTTAIEKVDAVTGEELDGAVFEITNLVTDQKYTLTTDEEGTVSEEVPFGEYTVEEITAPNGYRITEDIENITVEIDETTTIEVANEAIVEVSGQKTWFTDENEEQLEAITVELLANGTTINDAQVSGDTNWEYSFTNLYMYDENGQEIEYSIEEIDVDGYISERDGFDLTNIQTVDISGEKNWVEVDDQYRPDSITINLLADGDSVQSQEIRADDEGEWIFTFENLAKFDADGNEIDYTVEEVDMAGYVSEVEDYTITNTQETTEVSGTKTWLDDNAEDRPEVISVQVKNGETVVQEKEVTADDDWDYTFTNLPEYDKEGNEIAYTVDEVDVEEGYEKSVKDYDITNLRVGTTEVKVTKLWKDEGENDRPESGTITIDLYQNDEFYGKYDVTAENNWELIITDLPQYDEEGVEYEYSITEHEVEGYDSVVEDFEITNTRAGLKTIEITKIWLDDESEERPDSIEVELSRSVTDGESESVDTYTVTAENNWSLEVADLPAFDNDGKAYTYTIEEEDLEGYNSTIDNDNFDITNLRVGTTEVEVTKLWKDEQENDRPDTITINLLQNGSFHSEHEVTAEDGWELTISDLPQYDEQGVEYVYSVSEHDVAGYDSVVDDFEVTNTRAAEKSIEITKSWLDDESEERPEFIEVKLFRSVTDGEPEKVETYTVTAENDWTLEIAGLPAFDEEGKAYTYMIEENEVDGYETFINGFDITNLRVGTTIVEGKKTWLDDDSENRPNSITVNLLQNGEIIASQEVTAEGNWTYTFGALDAYDENGVAYTYTVEEEPVEGYETTISGYDITNTLIPEKETTTPGPTDSDKEGTTEISTTDDETGTGDRMPDTATNIYNMLLIGMALLAIGFTIRMIYRKQKTV